MELSQHALAKLIRSCMAMVFKISAEKLKIISLDYQQTWQID